MLYDLADKMDELDVAFLVDLLDLEAMQSLNEVLEERLEIALLVLVVETKSAKDGPHLLSQFHLLLAEEHALALGLEDDGDDEFRGDAHQVLICIGVGWLHQTQLEDVGLDKARSQQLEIKMH